MCAFRLQRVRRALASLIGVTIALTSSKAAAEEPVEPDSLEWDDAWPRFHTAEYVATGLLFAGLGVSLFAAPQTIDGWQGGILFDEPLRERVVLGHYDDRQTAVLVGDVFYYGLWAYPVVIDLGIAALAVHQSPDVAWQMFMIDAQAFALTGLVSTLTQKLVGRNRSYAPECASNPHYDEECSDIENKNQGFISGHTAMAFTGAGLVCVHHAHLPLYGGGAPDALACSTAMLGATISGFSRVIADRHFASDVLAAAAVGIASGYVLPELLHYRFSTPTFSTRRGGVTATLLPSVSESDWGLSLTGQL